jgi:hypothetical protein
MGKKSSVFMLRKSSKKKFNFYEEYKILGSTFDYNNYFKHNLFFDYWLKYTLKKLIINPIDIFYSKDLTSIYVYILVNKKYLLTHKESVILSGNSNINLGFTRLKYLTIFRWLKVQTNLYFNKKKNKLHFFKHAEKLKSYFFKLSLKKNIYYVFFYYYLDKIYNRLLYFFKYIYIYFFLEEKTSNFYIKVRDRFLRYYRFNFIYKFLNNLNLFLKEIKRNFILKYFYIDLNKKSKLNFLLSRLNYIRWYTLKTYISLVISKYTNKVSNIFFLNFNDFNFLVNNRVSNTGNSVSFFKKNFKRIKFFRSVLLSNLFFKKYSKLFLLKSYLNMLLSGIKFLNFKLNFLKKTGNFTLLFLLTLQKKYLYNNLYFFLGSLKTLQNNMKIIQYYFKNFDIYYQINQNMLWNVNLRNFYNDLKKNCIYFTVKESFFKKLVVSLFFSLILEKPEIFANTISEGFSRTRKHHFFLNNIEDVINIAYKFIRKYKKVNLKSITINIRGKFNGKLKRERRSIYVGEKIKLQNIAYNIKYSYKEAYTFAGVFGIKVWYSF